MASTGAKKKRPGAAPGPGAGPRKRRAAGGERPAGPPPLPYVPRWPHSRGLSREQREKAFLVCPLDRENCWVRITGFLPAAALAEYCAALPRVSRVRGAAGFGHLKPRREICYTPDGKPYVYSGKSQPTVRYPPHVLTVVDRILDAARRHDPDTRYTVLSTGVDIEYSAALPRGGSIGEHSDDEMRWGMVAVLSLGQTRYLRIRRRAGAAAGGRRDLWHLPTDHNSLLLMYGPTFQERYTHEVPKLPPAVAPETRWSLNVRFLPRPET